MQVQPYLFFDGRAEEAIEFYRKTVGAKVEMLMRFKDAPEKPEPTIATSTSIRSRGRSGVMRIRRCSEGRSRQARHAACD